MADKTSSTGLGLQSLPLELRLKIYRNLFIVGNVDFTRMHLVKGHFAKNDRLATESGETFMAVSATLQFLRVCKSVYAEGIPILYGENTYALTIHYAVRDIHLREAIGPGAMTTIKHLVVTGHHCMSMSAALGYQRLTGLQKLDIELGVNWFDPGKSSTWCRSSGVLRQADLHPSRGPKVGFLRAIFTLSQSISVRALARSRLLGQGFCDVSRYSNMRKGEFLREVTQCYIIQPIEHNSSKQYDLTIGNQEFGLKLESETDCIRYAYAGPGEYMKIRMSS